MVSFDCVEIRWSVSIVLKFDGQFRFLLKFDGQFLLNLIRILTDGGLRSFCRSTLRLSGSSLQINLNSWLAALCSAGIRFGLLTMSSRNSIVKFRNWWLSSKSWACFATQCLRTLSTRIVAAVDITDSFRRLRSRQEPLRLLPSPWRPGGLSGGLLDAEVAIANAAAAVDVLLLFYEWKKCRCKSSVKL